MPSSADKNSQAEFEIEYGERFGEHIEAFEPDFVKVLVRYNPEGDTEMNRRQAARLAELSDWLAPRETKYLFELIVPLEAGQAADQRPQLVAEAIEELHAAGVEPDVWKVEGMTSADDYRLVAEAARADGRDQVGCVVLGAGADEATVAHWLEEAAQVDGFIGFAIGRTIFWEPLSQWRDGNIDADTRPRRSPRTTGAPSSITERPADRLTAEGDDEFVPGVTLLLSGAIRPRPPSQTQGRRAGR